MAASYFVSTKSLKVYRLCTINHCPLLMTDAEFIKSLIEELDSHPVTVSGALSVVTFKATAIVNYQIVSYPQKSEEFYSYVSHKQTDL